GVSALAVRRSPLSRRAAVLVVGLPAVVMAAFGSASGRGAPVVTLATALGLPLLVLVLATMRLDRPARRGRTVARWTALGSAAAVVGVPLLYVQLMPAIVIGPALMNAAGYEFPVDGLPFISGALVVALPLAVLLATGTVRRPAAGPLPLPLREVPVHAD